MKTINILWAVMVLPVLSMTGCRPRQEEASFSLNGEAKVLLDNLKMQSAKGYMFGHHDSSVYGIGWENEEERSDVKSVCGDYPAVISFDLGHIEHNSPENLDNVSFDKIRKEMIAHYERGGVVSVSWHVDNPVTGGDSWDIGDTTAVASVLEGGMHHRKFMGWLDNLALFLKSVETAEGVRIPVIFRPWHEHTGSWFWWGQNLCTTEQYKELWAMTRTKMEEHELTNLIYAYSPGGDAVDYMERYPGDDCIDLLGFDTYQYDVESGETIYRETIRKNLAFLDTYCAQHDKAYAITETGYEKIPDERWWTDVLQNTIGDYNPAYVLVWRNAREKEDHYFAPYPGQVSETNFRNFYQDERTLFLRDIINLYAPWL